MGCDIQYKLMRSAFVNPAIDFKVLVAFGDGHARDRYRRVALARARLPNAILSVAFGDILSNQKKLPKRFPT